MKTGNAKDRRKLYRGIFGVTVALELLLYIIVVCSALAMFVSLGFSLHFYVVHCSQLGNQWMTMFGTFATVSFVPLLGVVATMISAYRNSLSEIEGDLAKCSGVEVQFRRLPHYANTETFLELQQSVREEKAVLKELGYSQNVLNSISDNIVDYAYQVVLDFKQDLAELYKITVCDLKYIDSNGQYVIRDKETTMTSVSTVKDQAGIKRNRNAGEHVCVFVKSDEGNLITMDSMLKILNTVSTTYRRVVCTLNFQKREFLGKKRCFPISRFLVDKLVKSSLRHKIVVAEFDFDTLKPKHPKPRGFTFNDVVYDLNIANISFTIAHDTSNFWGDYLSHKLKIIAGELKNEIA